VVNFLDKKFSMWNAKFVKLSKSLTTVTTFSKFIALFLFILLPFAGFYVGLKFQQAANNATKVVIPTSVPSGMPIIPTVSNNGFVSITLNDNGKTVPVKVGDIVEIYLGNSQVWSVSISDPSNILRKSMLMIAEKIGTQGRYTVVNQGSAEIMAAGSARCETGKLCPMYALSFRAMIVATN